MGKLSIILVHLFLPFCLYSQINYYRDTLTKKYIEASLLASTSGYTPLWQRSLVYGSIPYQGPGTILKGYIGKVYEVPLKQYHRRKTYDWRYEIEAVGFLGKEIDFRLVQAYLAGRAKKWELWVGRRKEVIGLGDSTLSSGFWSMSGNALPPVKYRFGTIDYIDIFGGFVGIHMSYADGLQDNFGPTKGAFIHQKSFYGRLGKRKSMINLFGGLNHNVSWGGESRIKTGGPYDYYPSSLSTYFYVVTALKDRTIVPIDGNTTFDDAGNQYGNHLGSIDVALQVKSKIGRFLAYKQTAYETGRIASLSTSNDGLLGVSWKNNKSSILNHLVIEYLYTANQGNYVSGISKILGLKDPHLSEIESYYNNTRGPWHYYGKGLGNPMIPIDRESATVGNGFNFSLNAVKAVYIGLAGELGEYKWMARASRSYHGWPRNHLLPRLTTDEMLSQTSWSVAIRKKIGNLGEGVFQLGSDQGERLNRTTGILLTIRKDF